MRVLVTGAAGMLGTDVCAELEAAGHTPLATDVANVDTAMDITDAGMARDVFARLAPDAVIHCAAYTNVDGAEKDPDAAYKVNALGSWVMATVCAERDIPLCAISTDFVFDGNKVGAYTEYDVPSPVSHYGASKLAGENLIRQQCRKHWIARTAWLFGVHGKSFPNSIITAAETRPELKVVADQRGCPTFTADLARTLITIVATPLLYGTYHVTNSGVTTWHEFASKAVDLAGLRTPVLPISSAEWPTPTKRPANSELRSYSLEMQGVPKLRPWQEALADFVQRRAALKPR